MTTWMEDEPISVPDFEIEMKLVTLSSTMVLSYAGFFILYLIHMSHAACIFIEIRTKFETFKKWCDLNLF
jgi:hypothetical protein